jgi:hypothetical protein
MKVSSAIIITLALVFMASRADASILEFKQLQIDFTNVSDATNKATWSEPDKVTIFTNGLGWDGEAASSRDGWIQTAPLAVGLSWRPPYSVSVRIAIHPQPMAFVLNSGQKSAPYGGDVYLRYSPDLKHWSTWQVLQRAEPQSRDEKKNPGRLFSGTIRVPYSERNEYNSLLREYSKLDVPWQSDEEAAVRWLLTKKPDFFSKHLPFIGYIEFRFEGGFYGSQRITSFKADVSYGMSGEHYAPKDKSAYKDRDSTPWRFRTKEKAKAEQPAPQVQSEGTPSN